MTILTGLSQGSILGPLLFLLYIDNLPLYSKLFSLLFADDTALIVSSHNLDELFDFVNTKFQKLFTFFRKNKLSLHPDKTICLLISPTANDTCHRKIYINNNINNEHDQQKIFELHRATPNDKIPALMYLGVYFDQNLNFKFHIAQTYNNFSHTIFSL